jgi:hypothetical protein
MPPTAPLPPAEEPLPPAEEPLPPAEEAPLPGEEASGLRDPPAPVDPLPASPPVPEGSFKLSGATTQNVVDVMIAKATNHLVVMHSPILAGVECKVCAGRG